MTLRRVLFLAVALLIAVGTALLARGWVAAERAAAAASAPKPSAPQAATLVLVAAKELAPGSFVKAEHLKWQPWPKAGLLDTYIVKDTQGKGANGKTADFNGAVARNRVLAGQPITRHSVVQPGERGFMAAVLTPGKRAVSVPVNATSGIAGFAFPGDKVDVILTLVLPGEQKIKRLASQTLLSDVRVLAMDQVVENADGQAKVAKTATLEVSVKQAEHVALALQMGSLSLSLRSLALDDTGGDKAGAPAADRLADRKAREMTGESYTLDRELLFMRRSQGTAGASRTVTVVRGDKAEAAKF